MVACLSNAAFRFGRVAFRIFGSMAGLLWWASFLRVRVFRVILFLRRPVFLGFPCRLLLGRPINSFAQGVRGLVLDTRLGTGAFREVETMS